MKIAIQELRNALTVNEQKITDLQNDSAMHQAEIFHNSDMIREIRMQTTKQRRLLKFMLENNIQTFE